MMTSAGALPLQALTPNVSARSSRFPRLSSRPTKQVWRNRRAIGFGNLVAPHAAILPTEFKVEIDRRSQLELTLNIPKEPIPEAQTRTAFMAGNWKMNPTTIREALALAALLATTARNLARDKPDLDVEVAVFPPTAYLSLVMEKLKDTDVQLGVQDVHFEGGGAYTGALSVGMVKSLGATYVLCGHSERRSLFGDDDAAINRKVLAVLDAGLKPILCVGETKEQYDSGLVQEVCAQQMAEALRGVTAKQLADQVTVAYEPVWAIGTGLTATPAIAQSVHAYIRCWMTSAYGESAAQAVRIQYGGSVTPDTVDAIMEAPDVDGCLVGGASLACDKFARIWNYGTIQNEASPPRLWAHKVLDCNNVLGESPVWSTRDQTLYWVDSNGHELWQWDLETSARHWSFDEVVGCVALSKSGDLLLGLESGLSYFNTAIGEISLLCEFEHGLNTRPNDGRCDKEGNFVIGSYNNNHRGDGADLGGLYRLNGQTKALTEILDYRFRCSNCICFSPDGQTMYFCDTPTRRIYSFDYSPQGKLRNRQLVYEMPSHMEGGPDGAQCDADGFLWAAISGAGRVIRISPAGVVDKIVELPVKSPTSCTFGGQDLDTLYITTRGPDGGGLYAVTLPDGIRGQVEPEFNNFSIITPHNTASGLVAGGTTTIRKLGLLTS